ncbi:MAG: hypothetical protein ISR58_08635 [Anaerolineales bacterium]|nr:hypothetical protein [Anaerolineales bacterium]
MTIGHPEGAQSAAITQKVFTSPRGKDSIFHQELPDFGHQASPRQEIKPGSFDYT